VSRAEWPQRFGRAALGVRARAGVGLVVVALVAVTAWHALSGAEAKTAPSGSSRSRAYYIAESCQATPEHARICKRVLEFLAAFDLGDAERACRQFSRRYLMAPNVGGLDACARYVRSHGAALRIEYSILSARMRPDGGEVVYTINPIGRRAAEKHFVAILIADRGPPKIDAVTRVEP
jgi:hypothetical protein